MAACALASSRVRDGALVSPERYTTDLLILPPEDFYAAAEDALPADPIDAHDFNYIEQMRKYIGTYFTILSIRQWHDETNWPSGLSAIEREEMRRLYWSIYTLDIYSSTVWGGCFHFQEAHARVDTSPDRDAEWLVGWNFTTDLYRILEHALSRLRTQHSRFNLFRSEEAITTNSPAGGAMGSANRYILQRVDSLYTTLPPIFKELRPATGNIATDIYGFQAANIKPPSPCSGCRRRPEKKCAVAEDILTIFDHVPESFQRAISTPLIYHLAGIGNILGSVMEGPLSETSYQRARGILRRRAGAGKHLRELVERIDVYMASRREPPPAAHIPPPLDNRMDSRAHPPVAEVNTGVIDNLSPMFQLPDELLQDWNWPSMLLSDTQQAYL
ncbi:unnamed protein product [Parascedosporium putredinis]|uniref:Transcription factor domain-containing protein n=1 Tax=Parascedosporium putredinis TaxID=1442378 RepID=A0A9P1MGC8_9PEZI|nr:unnamed protein product [Parascedosporium putredinis]CAI8005171.1 unnamed protein product [Parascedosporium putredinis]